MSFELKNEEVVKSFLSGQEARGVNLNSRMVPGGLALFSYNEPIAILIGSDGDYLALELDWKYSRTTDRHRRLCSTPAQTNLNSRGSHGNRYAHESGLIRLLRHHGS